MVLFNQLFAGLIIRSFAQEVVHLSPSKTAFPLQKQVFGQATAYKIGMNKILELREKAKSELGEKFDIREFHDVVLGSGPVPLNILEQFVNDYINEKKNA